MDLRSAGDVMSLEHEIQIYREQTPRSREIWDRARQAMPGGDTRTSVFWAPYPIYFTRGRGSRLWDEDGVERVDFINNFTSLILGHAAPAVVEALGQAAANGTAFGGGNQLQVRLAEMLVERIPSLELVRFTNSGTEATLNCVRAARAFTGRTMIAKAEGGYHGTHDATYVSVKMSPEMLGDPEQPRSVAATDGIPQSTVDDVVVLPFNDIEATREILLRHEGLIAGVIIEPMLGSAGMIPADPAYLDLLRNFTESDGSLLIFDEVISLRVAYGGAQERYGVTPDLTAMAKVIGGGMPVGAFGGRGEVMELFDPTRGPRVAHAGTFQGNPMTMAAGIATLEMLTPDVYPRMERLRDHLAEGIRDLTAEMGLRVQVTGMGSCYGIHFLERQVRNFRDAAAVDQSFKHQIYLGLLNEGVVLAPYMVGALSTANDDADVDLHLDALRNVLSRDE